MGRPSKFTAERRTRILEALEVGASQRTAAAIAGIGHSTLTEWLQRGADSKSPESYRTFLEKVRHAEALPKMRALGIVQTAMADRPELAWKFIERREPGFAPPAPLAPAPPSGPMVIELRFAGGGLPQLAPAEVIEGEVVDEQDSDPDETPPTPA